MDHTISKDVSKLNQTYSSVSIYWSDVDLAQMCNKDQQENLTAPTEVGLANYVLYYYLQNYVYVLLLQQYLSILKHTYKGYCISQYTWTSPNLQHRQIQQKLFFKINPQTYPKNRYSNKKNL